MVDSDKSATPSQTFRVGSSTETFTIKARLDNKTGQYIILWKDIQNAFEDAKHVKHGNTIVSYLTDDDFFEIEPLRFDHRPDVVLEVVMKNSNQESEAFRITGASSPVLPSSPKHGLATPISLNRRDEPDGIVSTLTVQDTVEVNSASEQISGMSIADNASMDSGLPGHSNNITLATQSTPLAPLYGSLPEASTSGQETQVARYESTINVQFDRMNADIDKRTVPQEEILQMQRLLREVSAGNQTIQEVQHNTGQDIMEKIDQVLLKQQQALDQLSVIKSRVEAIFTQNYELHECPIPRLFIVLPKPLRRRDKVVKHVSRRFRLYFLCECGTHTMSEGCATEHKIHLAKHGGYDITRPTEFFKKFGPRVLRVLQWLRHVIAVAGVVVPGLAHFKLVEGIDDFKKNFEFSKKDFGPLLDKSIEYIEGQISKTGQCSTEIAEHTNLEKLEALEGADLRQLEWYLHGSDQENSLANLYRIVTREGHVKWVCIDHYRENYRLSAMEKLRDAVMANNGIFIEQEGKVQVKIGSKTQAKQFYDAIVGARGVQELDITLQWDATKEDLETFAKAISTANIVDLTMDGSNFKGPVLDLANRGRRFDPLILLMSNERIQSLHLRNFEDIYQRIASTSILEAPKLRILRIDPELRLSLDLSTLRLILKNCINLNELEVETEAIQETVEELGGEIPKLKKLERVIVNSPQSYAKMSISEGSITGMEVASYLLSFVPDSWDMLQKGHLSNLQLYTISAEGEGRLGDILRLNPKLSEVLIGCDVKRCVDIIARISSTREELLSSEQPLSSGESFSALTLNLFDEAQHYDNDISSMIMVHFPDKSGTADGLSFIVDTGASVDLEKSGMLAVLFRRYGPLISNLVTDEMFSDLSASNLDNATKDDGSKLTYLSLKSRSITLEGLDSVDRVISRSEKLNQLTLDLQNLETSLGQEKAQRLLSRYGTKAYRPFR
ncbi:hypothetical protein EDD21DRAFT_193477 [Dissophora ornata]|nr:hypothetical protein EDD21DRAFT_193477 [Dissophora ornata]